jgi:hypothetical protein
MVGYLLAALIVGLSSAAFAHEDADWIQRQQLRNSMGEYCCGVGDCHPVDKANFIAGPGGYLVARTARGPREERIPYSEAMPLSIDGRLWICRRPDGTRRCVFDQPPGM